MEIRQGTKRETEDGQVYWEIPLTKGKTALVDDCDYPLVRGVNWTAMVRGNTCYAIRHKTNGARYEAILMHRVIMGGTVMVDHKDGNGLNNRRSNLRPCSRSQNGYNARRRCDNISGFKGVYWGQERQVWIVAIAWNGKQHHIGEFPDKVAAAIAYNQMALKVHGEFAQLNVIPNE